MCHDQEWREVVHRHNTHRTGIGQARRFRACLFAFKLKLASKPLGRCCRLGKASSMLPSAASARRRLQLPSPARDLSLFPETSRRCKTGQAASPAEHEQCTLSRPYDILVQVPHKPVGWYSSASKGYTASVLQKPIILLR